MRTLTTLMLTAALAIPAFAQPPRGGGGMFGGGGGAQLLRNEDVQKDLKLTDEQKTKIKEFQDKQQAAMREAFGGGGQPDREKMQEMFKKNAEESAKFLKETLTEDQNKRLKQISLQASMKNNPAVALFTPTFENMMFGLGDPTETGKALKVTDEQKDKIKSIAETMQKDLRELRPQGGGRPSADEQKKMDAVRKEATEKIMETLTDDQRKTLKDLQGEEFKGNLGGGQGRRPGAGGAGGAGGGAGNGQGRGGRGNRGGNDTTPPKKDGDKPADKPADKDKDK
jgi:Spy/CpxP family protein refolding chaperone